MTVIDIKQLLKEIEALNRMPDEAVNEAYARELLQCFFDEALISGSNKGACSALRLLYKINLLKSEPLMKIKLNELVAVLSFCLDLILSENGKRVLFVSDVTDSVTVGASPEKLSLAVLNLLFNITTDDIGPYYFISVYSNSKNAIIKIEFEGFCSASFFTASGADYIYSSGGCIFLCRDDVKASAFICLPLNNACRLPEYQTPNAEDLIFDRLSIIYSSLFL